MNIDEAIKARAKLETDIEEFASANIRAFEQETGLFVSDIRIKTLQAQSVGDAHPRMLITSVQLEVLV